VGHGDKRDRQKDNPYCLVNNDDWCDFAKALYYQVAKTRVGEADSNSPPPPLYSDYTVRKLLQDNVELVLLLQRRKMPLVRVRGNIRLPPLVCEQILLVLDHLARRVDRPLEVVAMVDRIGWAGINTETAENAATVIYLVDLRVTMILPDTLIIGSGILGTLDVDRVSRTGSRTEEAGDTLLLAILVDIKEVLSTKSAVDVDRLIRVTYRLFSCRYVAQGDAHPLGGGPSNIDHLLHRVDDISKY